MKRQKSFRRYAGIMTIICLALAVVVIMLGMAFAPFRLHR